MRLGHIKGKNRNENVTTCSNMFQPTPVCGNVYKNNKVKANLTLTKLTQPNPTYMELT